MKIMSIKILVAGTYFMDIREKEFEDSVGGEIKKR